jgi:hypothetical protein
MIIEKHDVECLDHVRDRQSTTPRKRRRVPAGTLKLRRMIADIHQMDEAAKLFSRETVAFAAQAINTGRYIQRVNP